MTRKRRIRGGGEEEVPTSWIIGRLRRIFGVSWKFRLSADAPAGRFCSEGARFMANSGMSADVHRNRRLIGAIRMNSGPHRSAADCVGSLGGPENRGRARIRPPAVSTAKGRDLWNSQEERPEFRGIATYLEDKGVAGRIYPWPIAEDRRGILKIPAVRGYARRPVLRRRRGICAKPCRRSIGLYSNFAINLASVVRALLDPAPRAGREGPIPHSLKNTKPPQPKNGQNQHRTRAKTLRLTKPPRNGQTKHRTRPNPEDQRNRRSRGTLVGP